MPTSVRIKMFTPLFNSFVLSGVVCVVQQAVLCLMEHVVRRDVEGQVEENEQAKVDGVRVDVLEPLNTISRSKIVVAANGEAA